MQLSEIKPTLITHKKTILLSIVVSFLSWILISLAALASTPLFAKQKNITATVISSKIALPFIHTLSFLSFSSNSTIEALEGTYELITHLDELSGLIDSANPTSFSLQNISLFFNKNEEIITKIVKHAPQSPVVQKLVDPSLLSTMQLIEPQLPMLGSYLEKISLGTHTYVIIFQNSEELRATGGFLGSYALVNLYDGVIADIIIEDVYDADGQFTGYIAAPAGVNEYLSSNNGLRLPDANWFADFPTSAETIMQFFALSNKQSIDGVISVNLETIQAVVQLVEPLWLPDYQTHVTSENLSIILREKRGEFFPGSQDKKQLLKHVWNQLKIALTQLDITNQQQLITTIFGQLKNKHIQIYSSDPTIQTFLENTGIAGQLTFVPHYFLDTEIVCENSQTYPTCPTDYFYLVESNVGVNKANRSIARAATITISEYRSSVALVLTNHNQPPTATELLNRKTPGADHNAYVNYQRILVPADYTVRAFSSNNTPIEKIDEAIITSTAGVQFKELGFLVAIREGETQTITMEFSHSLKSAQDVRFVTIQKQPGVQPYSITVSNDTHQKQFLLEKDTVVEFVEN